MTVSVPIKKVGTMVQPPNWRYDLFKNPSHYKVDNLFYNPTNNSGSLKRHVEKGLDITVNYHEPSSLIDSLNCTRQEKNYLFDLYRRHYFKMHKTKAVISNIFNGEEIGIYSAHKILSDPWIIKLKEHLSNIKYYKEISFAIKINESEGSEELLKYLKYAIYLGVSDVVLAKHWSTPVLLIEAVRSLFFDFSFLSKDRTTHFAQLRQLVLDSVITEEDFHFFRRAYDLGDLALKAYTNSSNLNDDERVKLENYLSSTAVSNLFNIESSVRTRKDAVEYHNIVLDMGKMRLEGKRIKQLDAQTDLIKTRTNILDNTGVGTTTEEDQKLIAMIRDSYKNDKAVIEVETLADLK